MHSLSGNSKDQTFLKQAVDLLSEDDCIILRKSRKNIWYKPHVVQWYPEPKTSQKPSLNDDMLIDNGRRSRERFPVKYQPAETNLLEKNSHSPNRNKELPSQTRDRRPNLSKELKDSQIIFSIEEVAQLLRLAVVEKSSAVFSKICNQLRVMNEKAKKSVLNKLDLNTRMNVIRSMHSGSSEIKKPPTLIKRDIQSPRSRLTKSRLSSSLSRIEEQSTPYRKPIGTYLSFHKKDVPALEIPKMRDFEKEDRQSRILLRQIEELQNQNSELAKEVRELISKNYKLEDKLEKTFQNDIEIQEWKTKMDGLTKWHDDIIENVYKAYWHLTKNLKHLKLNPSKAFSSTNLSCQCIHRENPCLPRRCHSLDSNRKKEQFPKLIKKTSTPVIQPRTTNSSIYTPSVFLSKRKLSLENELAMANEKLKTMNQVMVNDPINSAIYKKHLLEQRFLQQHQTTLKAMLRAMT